MVEEDPGALRSGIAADLLQVSGAGLWACAALTSQLHGADAPQVNQPDHYCERFRGYLAGFPSVTGARDSALAREVVEQFLRRGGHRQRWAQLRPG